MATTRKTAKAGGRETGADRDARDQAERLSRSLSESAQQIWLAGVGAFARAQAEGTKLFDGLVREGQTLEKSARRFADERADVVREAVETRVGQARERATETWERLEGALEDRVHATMVRMGVPAREDLRDLSRRVDELTAELRRRDGAAPVGRTRAAKSGAAKPATGRPAPRKTAAGKTTSRKAPAKRAAPKAPAAAKAAPRKARPPVRRRSP